MIIYELHYYSFIESQGRCQAICNTVENPFGIIWVPSKIEDNKDCKTGKHSKDCTFTYMWWNYRYAPETALINSTNKANYWLIFIPLLAIAYVYYYYKSSLIIIIQSVDQQLQMNKPRHQSARQQGAVYEPDWEGVQYNMIDTISFMLGNPQSIFLTF